MFANGSCPIPPELYGKANMPYLARTYAREANTALAQKHLNELLAKNSTEPEDRIRYENKAKEHEKTAQTLHEASLQLQKNHKKLETKLKKPSRH